MELYAVIKVVGLASIEPFCSSIFYTTKHFWKFLNKGVCIPRSGAMVAGWPYLCCFIGRFTVSVICSW